MHALLYYFPSNSQIKFSELTLGRIVGEGGFCTVRLVLSVALNEIYDVTTDDDARARQRLAQRMNQHLSTGSESSFVMKTLRHDLPPDEYDKGIVDLAIEADFLAVISHPHIISMRATANSDPSQPRFFVVLDRLVMTLDRKFNYWRGIQDESTGVSWWLGYYCCAKKSHVLHELWKDRLSVAHDIASALQYLHRHNIIYRDLVREDYNMCTVCRL
jgi:serine/threonine protein kinase